MVSGDAELTVFFDGSCPLCRAEIGYYKKQNGADCLEFQDVSTDESSLPAGLTRDQAMARFHVRNSEGSMLSGAAAFVEIWRNLPGWRWVGGVASMPGMLAVMEFGYVAFLKIRPFISGLIGRFQR